MKYFISLSICFILAVNSIAQSAETFKAPRLSKTAISTSGCFAYLPDDKTEKQFETSYSDDSSLVFTGDFESGDYHFSVIVVKLKDQVLTSNEDKEGMMMAYLDFLKTAFEISNAAGYGKGHTMNENPKALGIIDYWEDKEKAKWAIKAWADENTMAVMMLYGPAEYPNFNIQNMFLNGFRF
ncbi:MAG: hypothetical protein IPI46_00270 [Bacteroidetes bacterium]|nr:hypothetical protein [Bacteroidota bacterium]